MITNHFPVYDTSYICVNNALFYNGLASRNVESRLQINRYHCTIIYICKRLIYICCPFLQQFKSIFVPGAISIIMNLINWKNNYFGYCWFRVWWLDLVASFIRKINKLRKRTSLHFKIPAAAEQKRRKSQTIKKRIYEYPRPLTGFGVWYWRNIR